MPIEQHRHSPKGLGSDRDGDGSTGVDNLLSSNETIGTLHGDTPTGVLSQVLSDLEHQPSTLGGDLGALELDVQGVEDGREVGSVELDVDDGSDDLLDGTDLGSGGGGVGSGRDCRVEGNTLAGSFVRSGGEEEEGKASSVRRRRRGVKVAIAIGSRFRPWRRERRQVENNQDNQVSWYCFSFLLTFC